MRVFFFIVFSLLSFRSFYSSFPFQYKSYHSFVIIILSVKQYTFFSCLLCFLTSSVIHHKFFFAAHLIFFSDHVRSFYLCITDYRKEFQPLVKKSFLKRDFRRSHKVTLCYKILTVIYSFSQSVLCCRCCYSITGNRYQ